MSTGPDEDEHEALLEDPVEGTDENADPDAADDGADDESAGLPEAPTGP